MFPCLVDKGLLRFRQLLFAFPYDAVIRVYEDAGNVIETHDYAGAYHFNFAGTARNLSNISLIRLGLSSLTFFNIAPIA